MTWKKAPKEAEACKDFAERALKRIAELERENKELRTLHGDGADDETIAKVIEQRDRIAELEQQLAEAQKNAEYDQRNAAMSQEESAKLLDENESMQVELSDARSKYNKAIRRQLVLRKELTEAQKENEHLRRPACGTEENWLKLIRSDDEQALLWFRAMLRESELRKKAEQDAERWQAIEYQYKCNPYQPFNRAYKFAIDAAREGEK